MVQRKYKNKKYYIDTATNIVYRKNLEKIVTTELKKLPSKYKVKKMEKRYFMLCPFHNDKNKPNLNVNISNKDFSPGFYKCHSCGANGPWDSLATKLNMKTIYGKNNSWQLKVSSFIPTDEVFSWLDNSLEEKTSFDDYLADFVREKNKLYFIDWPDFKIWRGFTGNFLKQFSPKLAVNELGKESIIFPMYINRKCRNAVLASLKESRYILSKSKDSHRYAIFPFNKVRDMLIANNLDYVVIVEGIRDCLSLIREGIPSVCIFGTQNYNMEKAEVLSSLTRIKKVFILADNDFAGVAFSKIAKKASKPFFEKVFILKFPYIDDIKEKIDPYSMDQSFLEEIKLIVS